MSLVSILSQSIVYFKNKEIQSKKESSYDLIENVFQIIFSLIIYIVG